MPTRGIPPNDCQKWLAADPPGPPCALIVPQLLSSVLIAAGRFDGPWIQPPNVRARTTNRWEDCPCAPSMSLVRPVCLRLGCWRLRVTAAHSQGGVALWSQRGAQYPTKFTYVWPASGHGAKWARFVSVDYRFFDGKSICVFPTVLLDATIVAAKLEASIDHEVSTRKESL